MPDIFKLQGTIDVDAGKAEASLKRVDSSARGTQTALNRISGRKVGAEIASGFDRGAQSASRLSSVVSSLQAKINSMRGANLKFGSSGGAGGGGIGAIAGGNLLSGAISAATGGLTDKLKQGWSAGIEYNKMLEKANISFTTLLGSSGKAADHLAKLQAFGEATPFEFPDLIKASQRMQAMGFDAASIIPTLKNVGDAVSAVGGGKEELDGVVTALGQMKTKGKISSEEMNQLAERGIPAWDLLAKAIGKTKQETIELAGQGRIGGGAAEGIVAMMGERFGGQMDKMSATLEGQESNFQDILNKQLGQATAGNFDQLKQAYSAATRGLGTEGAKVFAGEVKALLDKSGQAVMGDVSKLASGQTFRDAAKGVSAATDVVDKVGSSGVVQQSVSSSKVTTQSLYESIFGDPSKIEDPVDRFVLGGIRLALEKVGAIGATEGPKAGEKIGTGIVEGAKTGLDAHSPSREMIKVGIDAMAGLNIGLEAGKSKVGAKSVIDVEKMKAATVAELKWLRQDPEVKALLDVISKAEGANYNTLFGGGTFSDYSQHPDQKITRKLGGKPITSSAAGRYQILKRTDEAIEAQTGLKGFDPETQDLKAIYLAKQRGMLGPLKKGDIPGTLTKGNREWASLPGSPYGQPTKSAEALTTAYNAALEKYSATAAATAPVVDSLSSALDTAKQKFLEFTAGVISATGLTATKATPATAPKPVPVVLPEPPKTRPKIGGVTYGNDGAQAKPFTGQIGVGSVGSAEIKSGPEKITLSKDAEVAGKSLAGLSVSAAQVAKPATEATKAIGDNATKAGQWASEIKAASDKTGEATKELTAHFERFWDGLSNGIDDFIESGFSKDSLKNMGKSLLKDLSSGLISQATGGKANSIGSLVSGALTGKLGGGAGSLAASLPGGFAGGANPASGAMSAATGGTGGGVGNIASKASDLLSGGKGIGGALSKLPGAAKVGGFLKGLPGVGGIFGKLGGLFGMGGAGAAGGAAGAAGAAGGIMGKISGALGFAGPWGMIAGIGLQLAAPLLGKLFGGDPFKDYKKFIQSEYGVKVDSKSLLSKVQQAGQSKFGAEWQKRKIETVKLPEVRDMIHEYAAAKGMKGGKGLFSGAEVSDQYSAMNQIAVKREFGGAARAGHALLVGERRPEIFIPRTDGTVLPNVAMAGGGKSGGADSGMIEQVGEMLDRVASALNRFQSMPADQVVMTGARSNPDIITEAVDRSLGGRSDAAVRMREKLQYR